MALSHDEALMLAFRADLGAATWTATPGSPETERSEP